MAERFDVVVVGMGPGGEVAASRLLAAGKRVAVVERELIGGECAYWACIPSKTLLRGPEAATAADRAAGTSRPGLQWSALRDYRDFMVRHLDDSKQVRAYEDQGVTVVKGKARLTGPGQVDVDGRRLEAEHVIVATGSASVRPPVDGLDDVPVWTNREATTTADIPARLLVIGGSAVGVELGQFYARMGAQVTVVQRGERLLDREDRQVGELAGRALTGDGVDLRIGRTVRQVRRDGASTSVTLDDGSEANTDVIVLGAGRRPRTQGLDVEAAGGSLDDHGAVVVDEQCRAAERLWALGDVTGSPMFTHVAKYQARVVADAILGHRRTARYDGIPRVVFADPEIAAVGLTCAQAQEQGMRTASTEVDLAESIARPWTYEQDPGGRLGLLADSRSGVLVGAWAVAPMAGEWIHQAALAIRAEIPLTTLLDQVAQFPTYTEAYLTGLEQLTA